MLPGSGSREKELGTLHLLPTLFQNPALKHDCHMNYGIGFGIWREAEIDGGYGWFHGCKQEKETMRQGRRYCQI